MQATEKEDENLERPKNGISTSMRRPYPIKPVIKEPSSPSKSSRASDGVKLPGQSPRTAGVSPAQLKEALQAEFTTFGSDVLRTELNGLATRIEAAIHSEVETAVKKEFANFATDDKATLQKRASFARSRGCSSTSVQSHLAMLKEERSREDLSDDDMNFKPMGFFSKPRASVRLTSQRRGSSILMEGPHRPGSQSGQPRQTLAGLGRQSTVHMLERQSTRTIPTDSLSRRPLERRLRQSYGRVSSTPPAAEQPFIPAAKQIVLPMDPRTQDVRSCMLQENDERSQDDAFVNMGNGLEEPLNANTLDLMSDAGGEQDVSMETSRDGCCYQLSEFVQSDSFDHIIGLAILLNAVLLGFQTEYMAKNWLAVVPWQFALADHIFCAIFTIELILRATTLGLTFWDFLCANLFDCAIVGVQLADELISVCVLLWNLDIDSTSNNTSASVLRLVRFFRLIRILRLTRLLSLIGELRMLIVSILDSMRALSWALMLIWLIIYMFAAFFTQLITDYKVSARDDLKEDDSDLLQVYGSLGTTMLCMYEAICEGRHWDSMLEPLMKHCAPWLSAVFVIYISICVIGVMNMVTSVFVTSAMQNVEEDRKAVLMQRMSAFFEEADTDCSGTISWEEFQEQMQHPQFQRYLKQIDLSEEHGRQLYKLLNDDTGKEVEIEEIVSGCVRLHGPAKALDHAIMIYKLEKFFMRFAAFKDIVEASLSAVLAHLGVDITDAELSNIDASVDGASHA